MQREELELELLGVKEQMQHVQDNDTDMRRFDQNFALDESTSSLIRKLLFRIISKYWNYLYSDI